MVFWLLLLGLLAQQAFSLVGFEPLPGPWALIVDIVLLVAFLGLGWGLGAWRGEEQDRTRTGREEPLWPRSSVRRAVANVLLFGIILVLTAYEALFLFGLAPFDRPLTWTTYTALMVVGVLTARKMGYVHLR